MGIPGNDLLLIHEIVFIFAEVRSAFLSGEWMVMSRFDKGRRKAVPPVQ